MLAEDDKWLALNIHALSHGCSHVAVKCHAQPSFTGSLSPVGFRMQAHRSKQQSPLPGGRGERYDAWNVACTGHK